MFRIELPPTADTAELAQKVWPSAVYRIVLTATNPSIDTRSDEKRGSIDYHGIQPASQGRGQYWDTRRAIVRKPRSQVRTLPLLCLLKP